MESEGLKSSGKSNDAEATLRKGNLPKSEAVRTVDPNVNKGEAIEEACEQNCSMVANGKMVLNVIPNSSKDVLMNRAEHDMEDMDDDKD